MSEQTPTLSSETSVENRPEEPLRIKAEVSKDALSAWQQQNQRLIAAAQQRLTTLITPQSAKTQISEPEKIKLAEPSVSETQTNIPQTLLRLKQFAKQASDAGHYCLQDVCLLVAETLEDVSGIEISSDMALLLKQLPILIESYAQSPQTATQAIITALRHPALDLSLSDAEFVLFEKLLLAENNQVRHNETQSDEVLAKTTETTVLDVKPITAELLTTFEALADKAASANYYGFQDSCLLIVESLREQQTVSTELFSLLENYPQVFETYQSELDAELASKQIFVLLHHGDLSLPLSDDEFEALEASIMADRLQATATVESDNSTLNAKPITAELLAILDALVDKAASADCYGFQDSCLLIVEALCKRETVSPELFSLLENYPQVFETYQNELDSELVIKQIFALLHHPDLSLPLSDDEFETLEASIRSHYKQVDDSLHVEPVEVSVTKEATQPASSPISHDTQELIDLLLLETATVNHRLQNLIIDNPVHVQEELEQLSEELQRFANAAKIADFDGLAQVCLHVIVNVKQFSQQSEQFDTEKLALLREWVEIVKAYLPIFYEDTAGYSLLAQLSKSNWAVPLSNDTGAIILERLQSTRLETVAPPAPMRKQRAEIEDVSLTLPDDVNRELLDLLLQELPTQTEQFSQAMQHLKAGGTLQDVTLAQRVAHTIKGSGNTVGIKGIAVLTHHLEDILTACANAQTLPTKALLNALIIAADCLEGMSEALLGLADEPNDAQAVLQAILDWTNQIDREGLPHSDQQIPEPSTVVSSNKEPAPAIKTPASVMPETQEAMVRVPSSQIENLFRLSGESIILNGQTYERQRRLKTQLQALEEQFALLHQLETELEQMIDLKDLSGRSSNKNTHDFDALELDQYNELHTASRRMVEASVDAREIGLDMKKELEFMSEVLEYQQRLVIETQESIMQTRLVAVVSIVPRLQRALRQTCRLTEKQCDLSISGESLLIDGDTLNALVDPLMHLLRNAIDHGIEADENQRHELGKPSNGQIHIGFDREGNTILVSVRDDGRGLDFEAIRATAQQRGLLSAGQSVSEEELKAFILNPNFSTRSYSTQTSGRGVGMDAVYSQALALGGGLSLQSSKGKGLTVELRIPLPLSRSHALLAHAGKYRVAISSKGLTQIIYFGSGELKTLSNDQVLVLGDEIYPMVKLSDLLHIEEYRHNDRSYQHGAVLLVANEHKTTAVLVDQITDSRDVVIKNLGYYMRKIPGFIGATILGDGTVTPVLDIPELLRTPSKARNMDSMATTMQINEPHSSQLLALIVEDSLSQRRALEQILADAGYRVRIARDGVEAAELLTHIKPNIVLTDLEMPRMNGIELTSHIRSQASTKTLPIIMITSRTTQKHQQMAEEAGIDFYFTKPVPEVDLLKKINQLIENMQGVS